MNKTQQFEATRKKVVLWGASKCYTDRGNYSTERLKLIEEVGEVSKAYVNNNPEELKMELGDVLVVLTIMAEIITPRSKGRMWESYMMQCSPAGLNTRPLILNQLFEILERAESPEYAFKLIGTLGFDVQECYELAHNKNLERG